jgi:hypothetical protein
VIFGHYFESPLTAAQENWAVDPTEDDLPKLKRASDIMTTFWLRGNNNPENLRYYLVCQVQNAETTPLIARILKNANLDKVPRWPGYVVHMSDEAGDALLGKQLSPRKTCNVLLARLTYPGSPLGGTLAFLLAQHKKELGIKHVTDVTIFRDNDLRIEEPMMYLLYTIKDVRTPMTPIPFTLSVTRQRTSSARGPRTSSVYTPVFVGSTDEVVLRDAQKRGRRRARLQTSPMTWTLEISLGLSPSAISRRQHQRPWT